MKYTNHARRRMSQRGLRDDEINLVLTYGRRKYVRKSLLYVVGRKEVRALRGKVPEIVDVEGVHVITSPETGEVITAYRNHDLQLR